VGWSIAGRTPLPAEVTGVARFGLEFDETDVLARTWRIRVHR
jgi:hypothetical protein